MPSKRNSDRNPDHDFPSSRRSLILDRVHPQNFMNMPFTYACEQCSHFDDLTLTCTIGYDASKHRKAAQLKCYELTGRMAFCRFMEID